MAGLPGNLTLPYQLFFSYALGTGARPALEPFVQSLSNDAWQLNAVVPPNAYVLAEGVAQGQVDKATAYQWAKEQGLDTAQMDALVATANTGPPLGLAYDAWRRGLLSDGNFQAALNRLAIEPMWYQALEALKNKRLSPQELAVMVQRSVIPNQGQLPFSTDIPAGQVQPMPQLPIDAYREALDDGITNDRLDALTRIIGLPASPDLAARMTYRGIIDRSDFTRAIAEGNTRQEWAPFLFDGFRQIPTAEQYVEAHLRGWISQAEMYAGTAKHGMSQNDTDLEFQIHRRPLTPISITKAQAWGGTFQPEAGEITDPYSASVHQANLGPEWYDLAEHLKYTYSVPFWWRNMAQAGQFSTQEATTILLRLGNPPAFADKAVAQFVGTGVVAGDPHISKAQTTAWSTAQRSYIAEESTTADVQPIFNALGIPGAAQTQIVNLWNEVRALTRKQLSPAQIKKAYAEQVVNPATGAAWTQQEAIDALLARGYSQEDAVVLLEL